MYLNHQENSPTSLPQRLRREAHASKGYAGLPQRHLFHTNGRQPPAGHAWKSCPLVSGSLTFQGLLGEA